MQPASRSTPPALRRAAAVGVLALLAAWPAPSRPAVPVPVSAQELLLALDRDGDGRLSAAEYALGAEALFAQLDADRDGRLDAGELLAARRQAEQLARSHAVSWIEQLRVVDAPQAASPALSRADHAALARQAFEQLDADRDGFVSLDELRQALGR